MSLTAAAAPGRDENAPLADPGLHGVAIRSDIGRRLDRIDAEQLSRPAKQCSYFVQLLLQPGISHMVKLPRPSYSHNSPPQSPNTWGALTVKFPLPKLTVGLAGGDLRSEYGAAAPPKSCSRIAEDSGLQLSGGLHTVGDGWALACRVVNRHG
jgi:hypothetical protein